MIFCKAVLPGRLTEPPDPRNHYKNTFNQNNWCRWVRYVHRAEPPVEKSKEGERYQSLINHRGVIIKYQPEIDPVR